MRPNQLPVERATAGLEHEASVPNLLSATARTLVDLHVWGLVEVYGDDGRRFGEDDVSVAVEVTCAAGTRLKQLEAQ